MTIDQAIRRLLDRNPGAEIGETAKPGNVRYERARKLDFHFCQCARLDTEYATDEFVALTPRGSVQTVGYGFALEMAETNLWASVSVTRY